MKRYEVMLARIGDKEILERKALTTFIFEPKLDGTRVLIYKDGNDIELINRRGKDITYRYPELLDIVKYIKPESCVLDAELVVLDKDGKVNFNLLQQREQIDNKFLIQLRSKQFPATLFVFDILEKDGTTLVDKPLKERKKELEKSIKNSSIITVCPYTFNGKELWEKVKELGMEGVMAKDLSSKYEQGKRSWSWLKIKNFNTIDAIIIGFTEGTGKREKSFGALLLAAYKENKLIYIGKVGTGFDEKLLESLTKKMKMLKTKKSPLDEEEEEKVKERIKTKVVWIKPELIAEVKYLEITKDNELRAPVFLRLRTDKKLNDCVLEI